MTNRFSLNILSINQKAGKHIPTLPGLHLASPPRRSPRRRNQEKLILHLNMQGDAPLSDTALGQLLTKLAEVYYQTDGSTTSALRNVTDVLNKYLLDRNYRASSRGLKGVGLLTLVVLREDRIIYAQCGPSYIYLVAPDKVEDLHDPELSGSGLGLGKSFKVRYHQEILEPNQLFIFTPKPPSSWSAAVFKNLIRMNLSALVQRLLHKVDGDLEALLLIPIQGPGEINLIQPNWELGIGALELPELDRQLEPEPEPVSEQVDHEPVSPIRISEDPILPPEEVAPPQQETVPTRIPDMTRPTRVSDTTRPTRTPSSDISGKIAAEIGPRLKNVRESRTWSSLSSVGSSIGNILGEGWRRILSLVGRMLPDEGLLDMSPKTMALVAILVPLIMVIFGSVFYIKRGRNQLYLTHYTEAQALLNQAANQEDSALYYQTIVLAMDEIEAARSYQQTEEIEGLYQTLRLELDTLDRITRLDYQPLFSRGLGADVTITKIVVTAWNDLYMLNGDKGTVIWAQSNPDGYQIIDEFTCGPIEGHISVGPIVDIVPLPTSKEDQATILGIDKDHTMIFCYADLTETPVIFEDTSYTLGRGPVQSIAMSSSDPYNLYILDPEKRAIWIEYQSKNYHEGSEYFGAVDSPEMADAIEIATSGSELFILHNDGYITKCVTDQADSDPICTTPFEFSDPREGHESGAFLMGAKLDSFNIKGSPGSAVYILDYEDKALYRFSTQLEFQQQFRPVAGLIDKSATAFTVTMSDRVFLAVDDQIYDAQLIP